MEFSLPLRVTRARTAMPGQMEYRLEMGSDADTAVRLGVVWVPTDTLPSEAVRRLLKHVGQVAG